MNQGEYKHLTEAQSNVDLLLERRGIKGTVRDVLMRVRASIQSAIDHDEDETTSGCTDD